MIAAFLFLAKINLSFYSSLISSQVTPSGSLLRERTKFGGGFTSNTSYTTAPHSPNPNKQHRISMHGQ
jgi:hypothetical protein